MSALEATVATRRQPSRLLSAASLPLRGLQAVLAWRRRREGIRLLLELDDRLLRDAGYLRAEIERLR